MGRDRRGLAGRETSAGARREGLKKTAVPAGFNRMPGHLIRRAQQIAVSIFYSECRDLPVTPIQYAVMRVLDAENKVDQVTLSNKVALDRSTLGDVARRLEEKGWLVRTSSAEDRRQKLLSLSAEGRVLLEAVEPAVQRAQERILGPLDADERRTFLDLLNRLVEVNNDVSRAPYREDRPDAEGEWPISG